MPERDAKAAAFDELIGRRDILIWNHPTGAAVPLEALRRIVPAHVLARLPVVRFGLPGTADAVGLVQGGRFLGVEFKSVRGAPTAGQVAFGVRVRELGGHYVLHREGESLVDTLTRQGIIK